MADDDVKDALETNAQGPAEAEVDGVRARQHSLRDQIAADRYLRSQRSTANADSIGIRLARFQPPGATG